MLVLAGCGSSSTGVPAGASTTSAGTQAIPPGSSTQTLTVGGVTRTFHLYRPATMAGPAPLVVMLHGGYGSGSQAEKSYGWDTEADSGQSNG